MPLPKHFDETDLTAALERHNATATQLESALRQAGREVPTRPKFVNGDRLHECELLEGHLSILRTSASLANIKLPEARPSPQSSLPIPTGKTPGASSDSSRSGPDKHVDALLNQCHAMAETLKERTGEDVEVPQFSAPVPWGEAILAAQQCHDSLARKLDASDPTKLYAPLAPDKRSLTGTLTQRCLAANAQKKPSALSAAQRAELEKMRATAKGATLKAIEAKLAGK